jgi:hypothetical protein
VTLAGPAKDEATTDPTGAYSFSALRDGDYLLDASKDGYTFLPKLLPVALAGADVLDADFVGSLIPTWSVSGTISGGGGIGVTLHLLGPKSKDETVGGNAPYTVTGLPNGSYMLIPESPGWAFTPASRAFRVNYGNVTAQDFTAAPAP